MTNADAGKEEAAWKTGCKDEWVNGGLASGWIGEWVVIGRWMAEWVGGWMDG